MSKSMRPHKKTTPEQFELLVFELRKHPEMLKRNPLFGKNKQKKEHVWERITQKLNSIGPPLRTVNEWKKVFADLKTRKKNRIINGSAKYKSASGDVLLNPHDILDIETRSGNMFSDQLSDPTFSSLSNIEFEILEHGEEEQNETSSIKMEMFQNPIETVYEANATWQISHEPSSFTNLVCDNPALPDEPPTFIKTEPEKIDSSDESNIVLADLITSPKPLPASQPPALTSSRRVQSLTTSSLPQLQNSELHSVSEANTIAIQKQLESQTQLLETLKTTLISLTDRQAAAAERQALATERQAAAIERQAAATEAVLELFRSKHYDDVLSNNVNNIKK